MDSFYNMRIIVWMSLLLSLLGAEQFDSNSTNKTEAVAVVVTPSEDLNSTEDIERPNDDVIVVKDESGLTPDEIRQKAKEADKEKVAKVRVEDITNTIDEQGHVDISKLQERWEDLSPTPLAFDWIQTKKGEWFKGEIKALYNDKLEFDSEEIGEYTFNFDDIKQIKSYNIISVNIENLATFPGILRLDGDKLTIIQGENRYEFHRKDVVSFAPDGKYERNFWSAKVTASLDIRKGNTDQYDYSAQVKIQRRTAVSRLSFDYLGRITSQEERETTNNHRINQKYDRYLTKYFFWTPLLSEYYSDIYKNIKAQITLGLGVGYTLLDTSKVTWSVSGGPAFLYTRYVTVPNNDDLGVYSPAIVLSTKVEYEATNAVDITYSYKITYTDEDAGRYKHHMLLSFENEITSWLDFDITSVWDYILSPEAASDGNLPERSDFQFLIGLGIDF